MTGIAFDPYSDDAGRSASDTVTGEWFVDHSGGPDLRDTVVRLRPVHSDPENDLNLLSTTDLDIEGPLLVLELVQFDADGARLASLARSGANDGG